MTEKDMKYKKVASKGKQIKSLDKDAEVVEEDNEVHSFGLGNFKEKGAPISQDLQATFLKEAISPEFITKDSLLFFFILKSPFDFI